MEQPERSTTEPTAVAGQRSPASSTPSPSASQGRQAWIAVQGAAQGGPTPTGPPPSGSTPAPSRARRGPRGDLWLGLFALGYGMLTVYLRFRRPDRLAKLAAMKQKWGDEAGSAVHWAVYTVVPVLVGLVLIAVGLRG